MEETNGSEGSLQKGFAAKSGEPKRKRVFLSLLLVLVWLLVFAGLGYQYFYRPKLAEPPPLQQQYRALLKETNSLLEERKSQQQRLASKIDEKKRAYNILRHVKGEPEDSEICAQLVREKNQLQESLDWLNVSVAELGDDCQKLKNIIVEIDNGNLAGVNRENPNFYYKVKAALELARQPPKESFGLLNLTGATPPNSPDEQMKLEE